MSRSHDRMPQFNWPVFGPFLGILAVLVVVSTVIGARVVARPESDGTSLTATGTNPQRDAALPADPGRGGPGPALQPPAAAEMKLYSLPARVVGTPTVRKGPGTHYGGLHSLVNGQEAHVIACSPGCEWYRILSLTDDAVQHWVPATFLSVSGRAETLPVLRAE